jgi:hypothetical protein
VFTLPTLENFIPWISKAYALAEQAIGPLDQGTYKEWVKHSGLKKE